MKSKKSQIWQMVKFLLFSISAGIVQLVSFELLGLLTPLTYAIKYFVALVLSVLWNFTFNRRYTFRSDCNIPKAMCLVFLFYVFFTPFSTWLGAMAVKNGWNETITLLVSMILNFVLEYLYQRYVVYKNTIDTNELAKNNTSD